MGDVAIDQNAFRKRVKLLYDSWRVRPSSARWSGVALASLLSRLRWRSAVPGPRDAR